MEDRELIRLLKENDQPAFKKLVNSYQKMVINTCFGILQNREDAEDTAQEVFVEIIHSIYSFREDAKLSTWIYRIAVNKSLNMVRKRKRVGIIKSLQNFFSPNSESDNQEHHPIEVQQPDYVLQQSETARILKSAIDSLPDNQKTAFILSRYEDLSYKEIAEVMNLTLSSVESLIHRSKRNLQKKLKNYYQS